MKSSRCILMLASLIASTLIAQDAQVTPLMSKDLADFPGKEGLMITVVYPPGASDPIHRHNAHARLPAPRGCGSRLPRAWNRESLRSGELCLPNLRLCKSDADYRRTRDSPC